MEQSSPHQNRAGTASVEARLFWAAFAFVAILGAFFRFYGLNWDGGYAFHSDERNVLTMISRVSFTHWEPGFYVYGAFPVYLDALATGFLRLFAEITNAALAARFLSALWGFATLGVVFLLGKELAGNWAGILAAAILAASPFHIQACHYGTVEPILILLTCLGLLASLNLITQPTYRTYIFTGVVTGLALGTKTSALLNFLPPAVAHLHVLLRGGRLRDVPTWKKFGTFVGVALLAGFLSAPYTVLNLGEVMKAMDYEGKVVAGTYIPSYTTQFFATTPYAYQIRQVIQYGLGNATGLLCWFAFFTCAFLALLGNPRLQIIFSWALPYFLLVGAWQVKFIRYFVPLLAILALCGAYLVYEVIRRFPYDAVKYGVIGLLAFALGSEYLYALGFMTVYSQPNTRVEASGWFYKNVPPGTVVLTEVPWDEPIPAVLRDSPPNSFRIIPSIGTNQLSHVVWERLRDHTVSDDRVPSELAGRIAEAGYITLASKRLVGGLMNFPRDYKVSAAFYRLLFSGSLGFTLEKVFSRYPGIGSLQWNDDLAEESFQTYDHPKIFVFKKVKEYPAAALTAMLQQPPVNEGDWPRERLLTMTPGTFTLQEVNISRFTSPDVLYSGLRGRPVSEIQMNQPRDIDVNASGEIAIADFRNNRVIIADKDFRVIRAWGTKGQGPGEFNDLCGIAWDPQGNVVVADTWNHRIQKFKADGTFQWEFGGMFAPRAVEADDAGNVYATEAGGCKVVALNPYGKKIREWGVKGSGQGEFQEPVGIVISPTHEVFVCDTWNKRVQVFTVEGTFIRAFPVDAWAGDAFREPYLDLLPGGDVVFSDPPAHRYLRYSKEGVVKGEVLFPNLAPPLQFPMGAALDPAGRLVVSNTMENRLAASEIRD